MKTRRRIIGLSILFGLFVWVADAVLDRFFFYEGSFGDLLILNVPVHELYMRSVVLVCFIGFGVLMSTAIAKRVRAEEKAKQMADEWSVTFNSISDLVSIQSADCELIRVNKAYTEALKARPEQLVGQHCYKVIHKTGEPPAGCPHRRTVVEKKPFTEEFFEPHLDQYLQVSTSPILDETGEVVATVHITKNITARKQAEFALAEEKERLAVTLRSIGDGVIATDVDGRVTLVNNEAEKLTGWTQVEAIGVPLSEVFHIINEKTRKRCENPVEKVFETGGIVGLANHTALIARDGTERVIADSGSPIRDMKGDILGAVLVFRDVTELRQAEDKILEQNEFLKHVLESLAHPFYVVDADDYTIKMANAAAGVSESSQPVKCYTLTHGRDKPCQAPDTVCPIEQIKQTGQSVVLEHTHYNGGGQRRIVEVHGHPIFDAEGKLIEVIEYSLDITDRKNAEQALAAERERLGVTLRSIGDGVIATDIDGRVTLVNNEAEKLTGWKQAEAIGRLLGEVFHIINERTRKRCDNPVEKVFQTGGIVGLANHTALISRDGTERIIADSGSPIRDTAGNVVGAVLVFRDNTELREAERAFNALVESMVGTIGQEFFDKIVASLCNWLGTDYAFVGQIVDGDQVEIISMQESGKISHGYRYDLDGTPCAEVILTEECCIYAEGVRTLFPDDKDLQTLEAEGYIGTGLRGQNGQVIGILCAVSCQKLKLPPRAEEVMRIIAAKAGAEIERMWAEDALRESEKRYQTLAEVSPVGIFHTDAAGNCLYVNEQWCMITGMTAEEAQGEGWVQGLYREDRERVFKEWYSAAESGLPFQSEYRFRTPEGVTKWVFGQARADLDENGVIVGHVGTITDITKRKRAEEEIESLARFPSENPDPVLRIAKDGEVLYANAAGDELLAEFGARAGEGAPLWWGQAVVRALSSGVRKAFEVERGSDIIAFSAIPVTSAGYVNLYGRDITERKRATKALQKARNNLEEKVKQRTAELSSSNAQLRGEVTERKRAEQSLLVYQQQLRSLASQLSVTEERERRHIATALHDNIGQTLAISKLRLQVLRESVSSPEIAEPLDDVCGLIDETIQHTRSLTFDLSSPVLYELGLEAAVSEWLSERIEQQHGISTVFKDDGKPKPIDGDIRAFLFRAIRELLVNVVKHAHASQVKVSISRAADKMRVMIEDNGVGFDVSDVGIPGSIRGGFGIFSIRDRLDHVGGSLEIDSARGRGVRVIILAPLKDGGKSEMES